jgi:hypothetical protein
MSDRLRVEVSAAGPLVPHRALISEHGRNGAYLADHRDLPSIIEWLMALRDDGTVSDFRIGPPTLDEIYTEAVTEAAK